MHIVAMVQTCATHRWLDRRLVVFKIRFCFRYRLVDVTDRFARIFLRHVRLGLNRIILPPLRSSHRRFLTLLDLLRWFSLFDPYLSGRCCDHSYSCRERSRRVRSHCSFSRCSFSIRSFSHNDFRTCSNKSSRLEYADAMVLHGETVNAPRIIQPMFLLRLRLKKGLSIIL